MAGLGGKVAIVTGGSRGIGRAIASALSGAGAHVVILGRSRDALDEAVASGDAASGIVADVSDEGALAEAMAQIAARQPVSILINNAGTAMFGAFLKQGPDIMSAMLAQHVEAPAIASRAVLPGMIEAGWGRIVNIASTASIKGYPMLTAYCAAKHGMLGFTRALALEVARTGVTVNAICPGYTDTELVRGGFAARAAKEGRAAEDVSREFAQDKPMGRLVQPDEVAAAVLWLVSDAAGAVTGQPILIDGGESAA